jgi:hypothetical protein
VIQSDKESPRARTYADAAREWVRPADEPVLQKEFVKWSGISQILYFEHLPACLRELSFVDPASVPPFPHLNAGGYRPPGTFFVTMAKGDEEVVWNSSKEDFSFFGYERYDCGAPKAPSQSLHRAP